VAATTAGIYSCTSGLPSGLSKPSLTHTEKESKDSLDLYESFRTVDRLALAVLRQPYDVFFVPFKLYLNIWFCGIILLISIILKSCLDEVLNKQESMGRIKHISDVLYAIVFQQKCLCEFVNFVPKRKNFRLIKKRGKEFL